MPGAPDRPEPERSRCRMEWSRAFLGVVGMGVALAASAPAIAGVDECGNLRLESVGSCELKGSVSCTASCTDLGVYKKACATKLHTVCRQDCTLKAEPTCTDECTTACAQDCEKGINVICVHNCFGECAGACDAHCAGRADVEQCMASCEANCDGECDVKCEPVVDASCYTHCVECCGGSCQAQANMDCQTTCQDEQFEQCEYELKADCEASCSGDGALFCDGEYVLSGSELPACVEALVARGVGGIEGKVDGNVSIDGGKFDAGGSAGGCSATRGPSAHGAAPLALLVAALGWMRRRTRRGAARR